MSTAKSSKNELNNALLSVNESLTSTADSLDNLMSILQSNNNNEDFTKLQSVIQHSTAAPENKKLEKVSLLSLKNESMLSYVNSLLLLLQGKLTHTEGKDIDDENEEQTQADRWNTIEQRVTLERGIKPLEKKLDYQLDKLIRSYYRVVEDFETNANSPSVNESKTKSVQSKSGEDESEGDSDSDSDSESESEDETTFRPSVNGMLSSASSKSSSKTKRSSKKHTEEQHEAIDNEEEQKGNGRYQPPKINAALPPSAHSHFDDRFNAKDHKDRSNKFKLQSMEEYVNEMNDKPEWEASIGTNIVNHGKGGIKSSRRNDKENEVKEYEETNFTRLNLTKKKDKRQQKIKEIRDKVNIIGGEDFSIFNNQGSKKRSFEESTSRKNSNKKSRSAWDRAKTKL
ncbi:hypothetical protein ACO0QE_004532 [Hanseniaspora vineae]